MPIPSGLVSTSASPGRAPALRVTFASSTTPVTDSPYSGMSWSIEWPPPMTAPASATFSAPPRRISSSTSRRQDLHRERDDRQREDRAPAHRVDVGERVGRRDPAEEARIVHDRREEVDRLDDRLAAAQPVDRGVVGLARCRRAGSDPSPAGTFRSRADRSNWPDLAGAAGARGERRERRVIRRPGASWADYRAGPSGTRVPT